jgi:hypothetical protein
MDPPGLRRLRFPFFDSLVKERSGRSDRNDRPGSRRPVRRGDEADHPVDPGEPRVQSRDCLPTAARQYMAHEGPYLISTSIRVNSLVKKYCSPRAAGTPYLPQNGPHCNAHTTGRDIH